MASGHIHHHKTNIRVQHRRVRLPVLIKSLGYRTLARIVLLFNSGALCRHWDETGSRHDPSYPGAIHYMPRSAEITSTSPALRKTASS